MNFDWKEDTDEQIIQEVGLIDIQTHEVFSDKLKMKFLRLPLLTKTEEECNKTLERWLYLLKNMEKMESIPTSFRQEPIFGRLADAARVANLSDTERRAYDRSLKTYWDNYAVEKAQEERLQSHLEKGIEIGEKRVAKTMLMNGFDFATISKMTGLNESELRNL
ncbi:MAG: PD-(D/E)XK nuclease family transposase [Muribaculaceae bacterium]|nr:PD-(D/E)XK nuclease family transposase [Muribaculaceae bacterium]